MWVVKIVHVVVAVCVWAAGILLMWWLLSPESYWQRLFSVFIACAALPFWSALIIMLFAAMWDKICLRL